jgi:aminopeptidase N
MDRPRLPRRNPGALILLALALGLGVAVAADPPARTTATDQLASTARPQPGPHPLIDAKHELELHRPPLRAAPLTGQEDFDVLHYDLALDIDFTNERVDGVLTVTGESRIAALTQVPLDLHEAMVVSAVTRAGTPLAFTHPGGVLDITLDRPFAPGEPWSVSVTYGGHPEQAGFLAFGFDEHDGVPIAASLSEPTYARNWWPCKDVPDDKALADLHVTVPDTLVVASNGTLISTTPAGQGRHTFHWQETYPISTYLVSVAVTNYVIFTDQYITASQDTMPVVFYSYPERLTQAQEDWSVTVPMMETYVSLFGEYPFLDEKYGMAMFQWGGAMEHQTCTTYSAGLTRGDHTYDWVVAHELAHMWWGDLVTLGDWRDIWLNEGFATHAEALWVEDWEGPDAYRDYMRGMDIGFFLGTVYDPEYLFNQTVYKKGGWVLHMLRHLMGDEAFFQLLREWAVEFAYGNALTTDFKALAESVHGGSLAWFFDPWLYEEGRPLYTYWWLPVDQGGGAWSVSLHVEQTQLNAPIFNMPVDIGVVVAGGDTTWSVIGDSLAMQSFAVAAAAEPTAVLFDPWSWILRGAVEIEPPTAGLPGQPSEPAIHGLRLEPVHPNPLAGPFKVEYALGRPGHVLVRIYDVAGRLAARLDAGRQLAGVHQMTITQEFPSGVYFLRMSADGQQAIRRLVIDH